MITLAISVVCLCMPLYMAIIMLAVYRWSRYKRLARVGEVRALIRIAHQHGYNSFQISYDLSFGAAKTQIEMGLMNRPLTPLSFQPRLNPFEKCFKVDGHLMPESVIRQKLAMGYKLVSDDDVEDITDEAGDVIVSRISKEYRLIPPSMPDILRTSITYDQEKA